MKRKSSFCGYSNAGLNIKFKNILRLKKGFPAQHHRRSIDRYSYRKTHFSPRLLPSNTRERARSRFAHVRRHLALSGGRRINQ